MEDKILETQENLNENIDTTEEIAEPTEEVIEEKVAETAEEVIEEKTEEPAEEVVDEVTEPANEDTETVGDPVEEPIEEGAEDIAEGISVAPVEELEIQPEKKKKKKHELEEIEESEEEDGSFFKTIRFKRIKDKVSLALLLLAFAIPVGLLVYIVLTFFL